MEKQEEKKTKIAILGGGMAGLTAAFELTATPELRDAHEVTIHQMGWRLGGKCATGRGLCDRIEEHGIHAFVGSYYNALGLMSACLDELSREGITDGVIHKFDDAFKGADTVVLWEWDVQHKQMIPWPFKVADNKLRITNHKEFQQSLAVAKKIMSDAIDLSQLYYQDRVHTNAPSPGPARCKEDHERDPEQKKRSVTFVRFVAFLFCILPWILKRRGKLAALLALLSKSGLTGAFTRSFGSWLGLKETAISPGARRRRFGIFFRNVLAILVVTFSPDLRSTNRRQRIRIIANYAFTVLRGIFSRNYNLFKDGFEILDEMNYLDWLIYNGLSKESQSAPIAINSIDISYNYPDGDNSQQPLMAAGTYLRWTLRNYLNLRAFVWLFESGTGETLIAPLYQVLKARGVKFAFFHKVTALELSEDGEEIATIKIDVQAKPNAGPEGYDPLVRVDHEKGKFLLCWPSKPKYDLLENGDELKTRDDDFESYWTAPSDSHETVTLKAGREYDKIVFAISVGAVPYLFPGLDIMGDRNPPNPKEPRQTAKWRAMVAGVPACATQTLQVWFTHTSKAMGAAALNQYDDPSKYGVVSGTFIAPFNGQADFTRLIKYEGWKNSQDAAVERPSSLWYFSGALTLSYPKPGDPKPLDPPLVAAKPFSQASDPRAEARPFSAVDFPRQQNERVWDFSVQFLQATAGYLLPNATPPFQPLGLDFDKLWRPERAARSATDTAAASASRSALVSRYGLTQSPRGTSALRNQFWKANVEPTERYVQCPPGGTKARLGADESGFGNMVLAGDWIRNHLNIGSVEGAVMGGKLAARALSGSPALDDIVGYALPGREAAIGASSSGLGGSSVPDPFAARPVGDNWSHSDAPRTPIPVCPEAVSLGD